MKVIIIVCDRCGALGGADTKSVPMARKRSKGWWHQTSTGTVDFCPPCRRESNNSALNSAATLARVTRIVSLRKADKTWREIGKAVGMSHEGARLIYASLTP